MKAVHLCVDVQGVEKKIYPSSGWNSLKDNIHSMIGDLDKQDIPTIYVGTCDKAKEFGMDVGRYKDTPSSILSLFDKQMWCGYGFDLPVKPDSLVAYKDRYSIYEYGHFATYLKQNEFTHVIFSGVSEMIARGDLKGRCVSLAAAQMAEAGYNVYIAAEATNRAILHEKHYLPLITRQAYHREYGVEVIKKNDLIAALKNGSLCAKRHAPAKKVDLSPIYG